MHRVGFGYDSHRFVEGRPLVLGGVRIEHARGLAGHSDGDAVLHAVTDAVLGALALGDIGELFADTEAKWKGADSAVFVTEGVRLAAEKGFAVANCDVTVLAEGPKLSPYKDEMKTRICSLLGVAPDQVSIKAKTGEGMGFIGRGEGLVAIAVVIVKEVEEKDAGRR